MSTTPNAGRLSYDVSDRALTTLAILKVNNDREQSFVGNFLPFVYHCLSTGTAEVVSIGELQAAVKANFDITLPRAVLDRLMHQARQEGKLEYRDHVYWINHKHLQGCNLGPTRAAIERGYRELLDEAIRFADEHGLKWSVDDAAAHFVTYVDGFSSHVLASALTGDALPKVTQSGSPDQFLLHRFVAHLHDRNNTLFDFLAAVVKGRMLADALYFESQLPKKPHDLEGVEVYLDGPVLLRALGHAGPELEAPCTELLDMLKNQGALVRCFTHSATEAQEILDAAAHRVWSGHLSYQKFHGDIVTHLVRSGRTRSDIEALSEKLEQDLLALGVQTVPTPSFNAILQTDEEQLEGMLRKSIGYGNSLAMKRDIDSLTAINRLREGNQPRDLSKARALFVTHNYELFRVSAHHFRPSGSRRVVPHCVNLRAFTVLVWLREPVSRPELPRERIIADAYAALNPSEALWEMYNAQIEQLKESGVLSEDDVAFLRFAEESRVSLMDLTRGDTNTFTEGTVTEVLEHAREAAQASLRAELDEAQGTIRRVNTDVARTRARIADLGQSVGRWISLVAFAGLTAVLVVGVLLGVPGLIEVRFVPTLVQRACGVVAAILGIVSIVQRESLATIRGRLERAVDKRLTRTMLRVLALPEVEPDEAK